MGNVGNQYSVLLVDDEEDVFQVRDFILPVMPETE